MTDHAENLRRQAEDHPLDFEEISTLEDHLNYLVHWKAYEAVAELCRDQRTLDWGCNAGFGLQVLSKNGARATGLDLSARAVEVARRRVESAGVRVERFDGKRAPFEGGAFDVVVSFQVVEHVSDYPSYFSEIRRVLVPGGCAVFTTPNALLRLDPGARPWNPFHVREFSPDELRALLAGWFGSVELKGLFAVDELYWLERNRVERQKLAARHPPPQPTRLEQAIRRARSTVKRLVPEALLHLYRPPPPRPDLGRYSLEHLFYRERELDEALDLMAICR